MSNELTEQLKGESVEAECFFSDFHEAIFRMLVGGRGANALFKVALMNIDDT